MNKLKLKWKVFVLLLCFCALLLIILWLFQTVFLGETYRFVRRQELNRLISEIESEINSPDLPMLLMRIQTENDIIIAYTNDFVPPQRPGNETRDNRGRQAFDTVTERRDFTLANGRTVSLTFHAIVAPVNATINTLRYQLYIISGAMVILAVFLAIIIAKRVSKPIEEISVSASALAEGKYDTRFFGRGFYEIVMLSDTLNTTAVELGRVEALRRELMANVSHDMRTPLALIYSYAEMMNDFPDEITQEHTRVIMGETRRLGTLVDDVLSITQLESDISRLVPKHFSLTRNIEETVERTQELLKNEGYNIVFTSNKDAYVNADEVKIGRAFYNLLINAVNYSGDDKNIEITQSVLNNSVRISVSDSGEGIASEDLPFIWDRYYKSIKTHKRAVTGTGLGLSIVKKIIELHAGCYGVISEPGKGSTFWFEIPIAGE